MYWAAPFVSKGERLCWWLKCKHEPDDRSGHIGTPCAQVRDGRNIGGGGGHLQHAQPCRDPTTTTPTTTLTSTTATTSTTTTGHRPQHQNHVDQTGGTEQLHPAAANADPPCTECRRQGGVPTPAYTCTDYSKSTSGRCVSHNYT